MKEVVEESKQAAQVDATPVKVEEAAVTAGELKVSSQASNSSRKRKVAELHQGQAALEAELAATDGDNQAQQREE